MKKFGKFIALVFACLGMLLAFVGCGGNGCKEAAEALVSAKSFTVKKSDSEILRYAGNTAYWKYTDSLGEYTEYYFYPDSEGKHWIYEKAFKADEWTKEPCRRTDMCNTFIWLKIRLDGKRERWITLPALRWISTGL